MVVFTALMAPCVPSSALRSVCVGSRHAEQTNVHTRGDRFTQEARELVWMRRRHTRLDRCRGAIGRIGVGIVDLALRHAGQASKEQIEEVCAGGGIGSARLEEADERAVLHRETGERDANLTIRIRVVFLHNHFPAARIQHDDSSRCRQRSGLQDDDDGSGHAFMEQTQLAGIDRAGERHLRERIGRFGQRDLPVGVRDGFTAVGRPDGDPQRRHRLAPAREDDWQREAASGACEPARTCGRAREWRDDAEQIGVLRACPGRADRRHGRCRRTPAAEAQSRRRAAARSPPRPSTT